MSSLSDRKSELRITVSDGFVLLCAWLVYADSTGLAEQSLLACLIHELAHFGMLCILGNSVKEINITAFGAKMIPKCGMSYGREFAVAAAGPGINLICAWVCSRIRTGYTFAGIHLALAAFNLLPVRELDGARMVRCVFAGVGSQALSDLVCGCLDFCFTVTFGLCGAVLAVRSRNLTLLLMCVWLFCRSEEEKMCGFRKKNGKRGCQTGLKSLK